MPSKFFEEMWSTITSKKVWKGVVTNRKKSGEFYVVESTIVPILGADGEIEEFISIRKDITEYVKLEKLNNYQHRISQTKEEEHQKKLSELKEQMVMVFSHELKTPLNAIINLTKILAQKCEEQPQNIEIIETLEDNSLTLEDEILNIIELSKIKKGDTTPKLELCNSDALIESEIDRYKKRLSNLEITVEKCVENFRIPCDVNWFKLLLRNLITNSIKYGGKAILISMKSEGERFYLQVEDSGKGLLGKNEAFGLFEQLECDPLKRECEGLGVGLYLVRLICKYCGYEVKVESSRDLGGAKVKISGKISER